MRSSLSTFIETTPALSSKHGAAFGARWSLLGCTIALLYIASCDLFIPPDHSVPRYNSVHGERRKPALNPGGALYQPPGVNVQALAYAQAAPTTAVTETQNTYSTPLATAPQAPAPIDNATPAAAQQTQNTQPIAPTSSQSTYIKLEDRDPALARPVVVESGAKPTRSFWDRLAFWRSDTPSPVTSAARAPTNNLASTNNNVQVAGNYPVLSQTPVAPSAVSNDNALQRAQAVQSELGAVSNDADAARTQLLRDATSEPSLIGNPPPPPPSGITSSPQTLGAIPYADSSVSDSAVSSLNAATTSRQRPVENPAIATSQTAPVRVVRGGIDSGSIARPPSAVLSSNTLSGAGSAQEPIRLIPPSQAAVAQGTSSATFATADSALASNASNNAAAPLAPITLTPPPPSYSNSGYLPQSRYAARRASSAFAN